MESFDTSKLLIFAMYIIEYKIHVNKYVICLISSYMQHCFEGYVFRAQRKHRVRTTFVTVYLTNASEVFNVRLLKIRLPKVFRVLMKIIFLGTLIILNIKLFEIWES